MSGLFEACVLEAFPDADRIVALRSDDWDRVVALLSEEQKESLRPMIVVHADVTHPVPYNEDDSVEGGGL